jgi:hypothetical protein
MALAVAAQAHAARAPTEDEAEGIGSALGIDPACTFAKVSTVDERWALARPRSTSSCEVSGNGVVWLFRDHPDYWTVRGSGPVDPHAICPQPNIPTDVAVDLGLCRRASRERRTLIMCPPVPGLSRSPIYQPRECSTLRPGESSYQGVYLKRLRWARWGRAQARARGIIRANMGARIPARVTAYRLKRRCGFFYYTRLKITTRHSSSVERFGTSCP